MLVFVVSNFLQIGGEGKSNFRENYMGKGLLILLEKGTLIVQDTSLEGKKAIFLQLLMTNMKSFPLTFPLPAPNPRGVLGAGSPILTNKLAA